MVVRILSRPVLGGRRGLAHVLCGLEHGADNLVITGAAAEVAGEVVADAGLVGVRLGIKQRLGGDEEAGGADTALEGGIFEEG
jgi:hypothetical protein